MSAGFKACSKVSATKSVYVISCHIKSSIPLLAQIIGLVDVYDAVTTRRASQQSRTSDEAIGILRTQVEKGWRDHDLVEEFATLITEGKLPA